jgi:ERCC4-type nuclease
MNKDPFTIIIDTREQNPWEFGFHDTAHQKLDTGDYTIQGLENILAIERKSAVSEIATNLGESRFKDVIKRLGEIKHSFIVCEFSLEDVYNFPVGSDIPKRLWDKLRISGNYIIKRLIEIQLEHNINTIFCTGPSEAEKFCVSLMKRIYEKYNRHV